MKWWHVLVGVGAVGLAAGVWWALRDDGPAVSSRAAAAVPAAGPASDEGPTRVAQAVGGMFSRALVLVGGGGGGAT